MSDGNSYPEWRDELRRLRQVAQLDDVLWEVIRLGRDFKALLVQVDEFGRSGYTFAGVYLTHSVSAKLVQGQFT